MRGAVRHKIRRQLKHLRAVSGAAARSTMPTASKIGRRMRHLHPIVDFHACRTLTRYAGLEANRRQKRDRNFSCGKTRFFRGDDVAACFVTKRGKIPRPMLTGKD
jgi:hypothetical protein